MKNMRVFTMLPTNQRTLQTYIGSLLIVLFACTTLGAQAPCSCSNATYIVGTASPSGISTLSAAKLAFPGIETPGDNCVLIMGRFDVDANETWQIGPSAQPFSNVFFNDANSSIFVLDDGNLDAQSAHFLPCGNQWLGVFVQTGATAQINNCRFEEGIQAVTLVSYSMSVITNNTFDYCSKGLKIVNAQLPGSHLINGNTFYNCDFGIYMSGATNVQVLGNTYNAIENPGTGIHLDDNSENIDIIGDSISGQTRGISSVKSRDLDILQCSVQRCNFGIYSLEGLDNLSIKNCHFTRNNRHSIHVRYHSTSPGKNLNIEDNTHVNVINSTTLKSTFLIERVHGSGQTNITGNTLMPPLFPFNNPTTQYAVEVQQHGSVGGLYVNNNTVTIPGLLSPSAQAPGGILVNNASRFCQLDNNSVSHTEVLNFNKPLPYLIRVMDCSDLLELYNNSTTGGAVNNALSGISIENCPATMTLCCNTLDNSNTGLYITGPLNGAEIHTTTYGHHAFAALHYDRVTSTGAPQINHGNDWSGASGGWDARFDGNLGVAALTNYVVNNLLLPNGLSNIFVNGGNPANWFSVDAAAEPTCATSGGCTANNPGPKEGERSGASHGGNTFSAVPNPASQVLLVTLPNATDLFQVSLLDLNGKTLVREACAAEGGTATIRTGHLPAGVYLLRCESQNQPPTTQKVVVRH